MTVCLIAGKLTRLKIDYRRRVQIREKKCFIVVGDRCSLIESEFKKKYFDISKLKQMKSHLICNIFT
jgi:hypothetical protein